MYDHAKWKALLVACILTRLQAHCKKRLNKTDGEITNTKRQPTTTAPWRSHVARRFREWNFDKISVGPLRIKNILSTFVNHVSVKIERHLCDLTWWNCRTFWLITTNKTGWTENNMKNQTGKKTTINSRLLTFLESNDSFNHVGSMDIAQYSTRRLTLSKHHR